MCSFVVEEEMAIADWLAIVVVVAVAVVACDFESDRIDDCYRLFVVAVVDVEDFASSTGLCIRIATRRLYCSHRKHLWCRMATFEPCYSNRWRLSHCCLGVVADVAAAVAVVVVVVVVVVDY